MEFSATAIYVNINGVNKETISRSVNINGVWKEASYWFNINGTWHSERIVVIGPPIQTKPSQ